MWVCWFQGFRFARLMACSASPLAMAPLGPTTVNDALDIYTASIRGWLNNPQRSAMAGFG